MTRPPAPASAPSGAEARAAPEDERLAVPIQATGYLRLHEPARGAEDPDAAPLVMAIHGYRQPPAAMLAYAVSVAPAGSRVVAP